MLEFRNITKSFSGVEVLHDVSCTVKEGKVTAFMGENGAGKSTLMKILGGVIPDYEGEVFWKGEKLNSSNTKDAEQSGIVMIHQELNLVPDLSIGENIFLGKEPVDKLGFIRFDEIHAETNTLLKEFDFPYTSAQSVSTIGLGWQQLVEIAKALHINTVGQSSNGINSQVIIMDEPTSSLTEREKEIFFTKIKYLKSIGKTILYVSHRMSEIFEIADEVVIMRDGKNVGQFAVADVSREKIVELMIGKTFSPQRHRDTENLRASVPPWLELKNVNVHTRHHHKLRDISFTLNKGEVLGVAGLLGAGRTSLLKFLYGALEGMHFSGEISLEGLPYSPQSISRAKQNKIMYLSEDRKAEGNFPVLDIGVNTSASILDRISIGGFVKRKKEVSDSTAMLEKLNTKYTSLHQLITRLSGGNQQKVLLSRLLLTEPKLILLDEPTRGIDVGAKEEIYNLVQTLSSQGITFLVSSSEIPELERVCDRILVLSSGHQTAVLDSVKTNATEILKYAFEKV